MFPRWTWNAALYWLYTKNQSMTPSRSWFGGVGGTVVSEICRDPSATASPQQGDLRLSGPPSGQDAGGGARTRDRRVPADLRADSLATVPPTPPTV
ncbi:hypothetical protein PoB_000387700 [Plakobranchus ocellatus]|uniref:Uncharacterized protein n=1 Tax=Plakobranchus ocellatus TaxID=259542 RepID=A0AAV3Y3T6_9GAST|nr:hypothetical protein PoB_000387700 [Plakobranchus ocellatus]